VTLLTTGGDNIPMTVGYRPDADDTIVRIAARIRAVLGRETKSTHLDAARALIAAGRSVEAVKLVRENEGLTLTEAKRRVERIQAGDERRA
jgi:ribosomal protein L7/L12